MKPQDTQDQEAVERLLEEVDVESREQAKRPPRLQRILDLLDKSLPIEKRGAI